MACCCRHDLIHPARCLSYDDLEAGLALAHGAGLVYRRSDRVTAASVAHLSDKELGLSLASLPADARPYLFAFRKAGGVDGNSRETLLRAIRPTGNDLPGYEPSYTMGRMLEETQAG